MAPLYNQPVRVLLKDMCEELKQNSKTHFDTKYAIAWFKSKYPLVKESTIRAHLRRFSANDPVRLHYNPKPGEGLLFKLDATNYRLYNPETDPPEIVVLPTGPEPDDDQLEPGSAAPHGSSVGPSEFAYERDLQNFLAKNLHLIEPGLTLYREEDGDITGIEFDVGGRRIDILAMDATNSYVVIELKVSRGYDKVVGQILRYMSWIKKHQAEDSQSVRGIIIARQMSGDLRLATSLVPGIKLFEYQLAISLTECEPEM